MQSPAAGKVDDVGRGDTVARVGVAVPIRARWATLVARIRAELEGPFRGWAFLWQRTGGPKGDLVDDEFGRVLQVPGWSNIFTQPIINRIEMLSTGVRTDIGIKVFGPDLDTVDRVCKQIEAVVKPVPGARDVIAAPIMGKGYLDVTIDRERLDPDKPVKLMGKVTDMRWSNPHSWIYLDVENADGKVENWALEMSGANGLIRRGWRKEDLPPGTVLVVEGWQARNSSTTANISTVTFEDGRRLFAGSSNPAAPQR